MLPTGGHVVHLDEADGSVSTHTVAMFHQLRCLDILQTAYVEEGRHLTDATSCMNYLRQTLLALTPMSPCVSLAGTLMSKFGSKFYRYAVTP